MRKCPKPCLQTCWSRPEADRLETIVSDFLGSLSEEPALSKEAKEEQFLRAREVLKSYEYLLNEKANA